MRQVTKRASLHSHMDCVRDLHFVSEHGILATVSEDCNLKLWNLKDLAEENQEPYITLRGHTGPLFSVTGGC